MSSLEDVSTSSSEETELQLVVGSLGERERVPLPLKGSRRLLNLTGISFPLAGAVNVGLEGSVETWFDATSDFFSLPFLDGEAEITVLHRVLSLYPRSVCPSLIAEARRVTRPGGQLFVVEIDLMRLASRYCVGLIDAEILNDTGVYPDGSRQSAWDERLLLQTVEQVNEAPANGSKERRRLTYRGRYSEPELAGLGWLEIDRDDSLIACFEVAGEPK